MDNASKNIPDSLLRHFRGTSRDWWIPGRFRKEDSEESLSIGWIDAGYYYGVRDVASFYACAYVSSLPPKSWGVLVLRDISAFSRVLRYSSQDPRGVPPRENPPWIHLRQSACHSFDFLETVNRRGAVRTAILVRYTARRMYKKWGQGHLSEPIFLNCQSSQSYSSAPTATRSVCVRQRRRIVRLVHSSIIAIHRGQLKILNSFFRYIVSHCFRSYRGSVWLIGDNVRVRVILVCGDEYIGKITEFNFIRLLFMISRFIREDPTSCSISADLSVRFNRTLYRW